MRVLHLHRLATSLALLLACNLAASAAAPVTAAAFAGVWWNREHLPRLVAVDGRALPFTPQGKAQYEKNVAGLKSGAVTDDAVHYCLPEGMPRALTSAYPFQIMMTPGQVTFAHEANRAYRTVGFADQHADPAIWDPAYMGDGIAHWNNTTLIIDSTNFKAERIFLDSSGLPASDQLHLTEQLQLTNGGRQLRDLITIDDPVNFTRPWTTRLTFERRDDLQIKTDWVCGEQHRDVSALAAKTSVNAIGAANQKPIALTAGQMALNGYWRTADRGATVGTRSPAVAAALPRAQPWVQAFRAKFMAAEAAGQQQRTPGNLCLPYVIPGAGVPGGPAYSIAILVEPQYVTFLYEENRQIRIAYVNAHHPAQLAPSWLGHSIAHWDGDTLVVDTVGFNEQNLLGDAVPFTKAMHIVQRIRFANGQLEETANFEDPGAFTEPFVAVNRYGPAKPFQEYICAENNHEGGVPTATGVPTPYTLPGAPAASDRLITR